MSIAAAYSAPALRAAFPAPADLSVRNGRRPVAAAVEGYSERQDGAVARLRGAPIERIDAVRRQPRHRPGQLASDRAFQADQEIRVEKRATAERARTVGHTDRPYYSAAFLAQLAGQADDIYDPAVESRALAEGAAAYRDTANRGVRLFGPELSASYLI